MWINLLILLSWFSLFKITLKGKSPQWFSNTLTFHELLFTSILPVNFVSQSEVKIIQMANVYNSVKFKKFTLEIVLVFFGCYFHKFAGELSFQVKCQNFLILLNSFLVFVDIFDTRITRIFLFFYLYWNSGVIKGKISLGFLTFPEGFLKNVFRKILLGS